MSELELQIGRYIESMERRNCSRHTIRAYQGDLRSFRDSLPDGVPVASLKKEHVRTWTAALFEAGHSAPTIRRHIASLRGLFEFLGRENLVGRNPAKMVLLPKMPHTIPTILTQKQVDTLLDGVKALADFLPVREGQSPIRDLAILELLYGCGLRVSELVGLNINDIDRTEHWLLIRGKGMKERQVPYGGKASEALERYLVWRGEYMTPGYRTPGKERRGPWMCRRRVQPGSLNADPSECALFLGRHRGSLTERAVGNIVKRYGLMILGNPSLHPHSFRHAFATHMLDSGANLREIQELLGHSSISSTQIYTQVSLGELTRTYDSAHPKSGQ